MTTTEPTPAVAPDSLLAATTPAPVALNWSERAAVALFHAGLCAEFLSITHAESALDRVAAVIAASGLESADIDQWFLAQRDAAGIAGVSLGYDTGYYARFTARVNQPSHMTKFEPSLPEAVAALRAAIPSPTEAAKKMRDQAQELILRAAALEGAA